MSTDVSHSLGIQKMPPGYALMIDDDWMYFYWLHRESDTGSDIHWNKWVVWRWARNDWQKKVARMRFLDFWTMAQTLMEKLERNQ